MSKWHDILRDAKIDEKIIEDIYRLNREEKREKRRINEKFMNECEKKLQKEKTRELNKLKKEKQQEWKEIHTLVQEVVPHKYTR